MGLTPWYDADKLRYIKEIELIKKNYSNVILYNSKNGTKCLKGFLNIDGEKFYFILEYPETYPYSPPHLWPFSDIHFKELEDFSYTTHQFRNNSLCLFTNDGGPDSWHFENYAMDALKKFEKFIKMKKKNEHLDEHTSLEYEIPGKPQLEEIIFPISEIKKVQNLKDWGELKLYSFADNRSLRILTSIENSDLFLQTPWRDYKLKTHQSRGFFLNLNFEIGKFREKISKYNDLTAFLKDVTSNLQINFENYDFLLLIFSDTKLPEQKIAGLLEFNPFFSYIYDLKEIISNINKIPFYKVYSVNIPNDCFQRTLGVLDQVIEKIQQKKVLLIGLGSLGSEIALELAKTGINNFILFDMDTFQPVNVCRHVGNLLDLGKFKTEIVKEKILLRNPNAHVESISFTPFYNDETISRFIELIKIVDLIIITTADFYSEQLLNKFAIDFKKTVVYGWCGPNAEQGRIFRVIPFQTPCYNCICVQTANNPDKYPRIKPQTGTDEMPQFIGYRQPGIPGISIDINFIALFISKFSIQTLLNGDINFPNAKSNHYIWQNRPTDLEPQEVSLVPFNFEKNPDCPICGLKSKIKFITRKEKLLIERGEKKLSKKSNLSNS